MNTMHRLVMFSGDHCPACKQAEQWMNANGVQFTKVDVNGNVELIRKLVEITKQNTIPQFFHDNEWLSEGFRKVQEMARKGYFR